MLFRSSIIPPECRIGFPRLRFYASINALFAEYNGTSTLHSAVEAVPAEANRAFKHDDTELAQGPHWDRRAGPVRGEAKFPMNRPAYLLQAKGYCVMLVR